MTIKQLKQEIKKQETKAISGDIFAMLKLNDLIYQLSDKLSNKGVNNG